MSKKEGPVERFNFEEAYRKFLVPFPKEALKARPSRGMTLTSVSAQYIVERLNETVGIDGWSHRGAYSVLEVGADKYVVFEGSLLLDNGDKSIMQSSAGSAKLINNISDAYKTAKTESLSKCASLFGIANDVFKGLVAPPGSSSGPRAVKSTATGDF